MRFVMIGASSTAVGTARLLSERGHEVVVIEHDRARIDELSGTIDCAFLCGDGSHPQVLREASPKSTDVFIALTDDDRTNILASLVGRSLGYRRVVTSIRDVEYEGICKELGLEDVIIPSGTISHYLADMALGRDILELSSALRGEGRMFSFVAGKDDAVAVGALGLPEGARVMCVYRNEEFLLADEATVISEGDEVVLISHSRNMPALGERWAPLAHKRALES
jgi:trk/ktr system potassium uptake protein